MKLLLTLAAAAVLAGCASEPPHSWDARLVPSAPPLAASGGDLAARLGSLEVRIDDVILERNHLAAVTIEFRNDGTGPAFAMIDRVSPATSPLRGSVSRPLGEGTLAKTPWQPWKVEDGVSLAPGARLVLGLSREGVFAAFPPRADDEVVLRVVARTDGEDRTAELRFRVESLTPREEPNPSLR